MSGYSKRFMITIFFFVLSAFQGISGLHAAQTSAVNTGQPVMIDSVAAQASPCAGGRERELRIPSCFLPNRLPDFQSELKTFLAKGIYRNLKWCEDKGLRDTGTSVNNTSYGVHPTVKIYYSPAVINWLLRKNPDDVIPDGAMIVKEQYAAPAARYQLQGPPLLRGWTIMIKDAKGAKDGWYWDESWAAQCADNNKAPFAVPYGGFGLYCTRCHASAEKELTFTYTKNIQSFPGDYDTYFRDLSWASEATPPPPPLPGPRDAPASDQVLPTGGHTQPPVDLRQQLAVEILKEKSALPSSLTADPQFVAFYKSISPVPLDKVSKFPGETFDHIVAQNLGPQPSPSPSPNPNQFLTSDACMAVQAPAPQGIVLFTPGGPNPKA